MARMLQFLGEKPWKAKKDAATILALETAMSKPRFDRVERRDRRKSYNPMKVSDLQQLTPSINWNVFSYNDLPPLQFQYQQIHKKISFNGLELDSTLKVGSPVFYSLVDFKKQFEIYEKNKGMIYSYSKDLTIRNFDTLNVRLGEEWYYTLKK